MISATDPAKKCRYNALIISPEIEGCILELAGGTAIDQVPSEAHAIVSLSRSKVKAIRNRHLPDAHGITVTHLDDETLRIDARGRAAAATNPEQGENALELLVGYLIDRNLCSSSERKILQFEYRILSDPDGARLGFSCWEGENASVSIVGGTALLRDGRINQTIVCHFPASMSEGDVVGRIQSFCDRNGAELNRIA